VFSIVFWLSVLTWALAGLLYWQLERIRTLLRRAEAASAGPSTRASTP
jgi:hypothetical protein